MSSPTFPPARRGDRQVSADLLNAHSAALERGADAAVWPFGGFDFGTFTGAADTPESFLARVTATDGGSPPAYSWERVAEGPTGFTYTHPDSASGAVRGGPGAQPAYEENGNPNVPVGAIVRLWRSRDGYEYRWFAWHAGTAPSSPPAPPVVLPTWGYDTKSVGLANYGGDSFLWAHSNHVHQGRPPIVTIINNYPTIYPPPVFPPGYQDFIKDEVNKKLYLVWKDGEVCEINLTNCTPREPPVDNCVPPVCTYCDDPPGAWVVTAADFVGSCVPFNDSWKLLPTGTACTWRQTAVLAAGGVVTVTLTLDGGGYELTFVLGDTEDPTATATFAAPSPDALDCCAAAEFEPTDCDCGPGSTENTDCPFCGGTTPTGWDVDLNGFGGDLVNASGSYTLVQSGPCAWRYPDETVTDGSLSMGLSFSAGVATFTVNLGDTGSATFSALAPPTDCCADLPLVWNYNDPNSDAPTSLTLEPSCAAAQAVDVAYGFDPCPACDPAPRSWLVRVGPFAGGLAPCNGRWTLLPTDSCTWGLTPAPGVLIGLNIDTDGSPNLVLSAPGGQSAFYGGAERPASACCAEVTVVQSLTTDPTGPTALTLVPDCGAGPRAPCPGTVTAVPTCCDPACACDECPDGAPRAFTFTASASFTGDCAVLVGSWSLTYAGGCTWAGTLGDATAALVLSGGGAQLTFNHADLADPVIYEAAAFDCCDGGDVEDADVTACSGSPATLTLVPAGACGPCADPPTTTDCTALFGGLTLTASRAVCGTDWTAGTAMIADDPSAGMFSSSSGPADSVLDGFGVTLTCNDDGTFNVGPYNGNAGPAVYYGPPQTDNIVPLSADPLHLQLTFPDLSACGDGGYITIDITE